MATEASRSRIYDGDADELITSAAVQDRLILVPEGHPSRQPDVTPRLRIQWGQYLLDDLMAGRYRTVVCAVNAQDNSRGIIGQLASFIPTSQWTPTSITDHALRFTDRETTTVLKFDLDMIEVLALLRPHSHEHMTLGDLAQGFSIVSEMVRRKPERLPVASVSFLGAHANLLVDDKGQEPSFETVLRTMHEANFTGDVYPAPWMWRSAPTTVFARYPFPETIDKIRQGGF